MWLVDWLRYVLCSKKPKILNTNRLAHMYAIRQTRRRLDGSGTYKVYVIDDNSELE
ncbi:unnamed protein product [Ectocarpus sp. 12 AP-2014]